MKTTPPHIVWAYCSFFDKSILTIIKLLIIWYKEDNDKFGLKMISVHPPPPQGPFLRGKFCETTTKTQNISKFTLWIGPICWKMWLSFIYTHAKIDENGLHKLSLNLRNSIPLKSKALRNWLFYQLFLIRLYSMHYNQCWLETVLMAATGWFIMIEIKFELPTRARKQAVSWLRCTFSMRTLHFDIVLSKIPRSFMYFTNLAGTLMLKIWKYAKYAEN